MKVVRLQAVSVIDAVSATGVTLIIILSAHSVEDIDELIEVLWLLEDVLVIDASHHHMIYLSS